MAINPKEPLGDGYPEANALGVIRTKLPPKKAEGVKVAFAPVIPILIGAGEVAVDVGAAFLARRAAQALAREGVRRGAKAIAQSAQKKNVKVTRKKPDCKDFTPQKNPALWSGDCGKKAATDKGHSTLTDTPCGKEIEKWDEQNKDLPWNERREVWEDASRQYAQALKASGNKVPAYICKEVNPESIFEKVERPELGDLADINIVHP